MLTEVNPLPPEAAVAYLTGDSVCPSLETVARRISEGRPIEGMSFAEMEYAFADIMAKAAAARDRLRELAGVAPAEQHNCVELSEAENQLAREAIAAYANQNPPDYAAGVALIRKLMP